MLVSFARSYEGCCFSETVYPAGAGGSTNTSGMHAIRTTKQEYSMSFWKMVDEFLHVKSLFVPISALGYQRLLHAAT